MGKMRQLTAKAGMTAERIQAGLQTQQNPDGARGHLGVHGEPVCHRVGNQIEQAPPLLGRGVALGHADRHRAARDLHHLAKQSELRLEVDEISHHLENATPAFTQGFGDAQHFFRAGRQARRGLAVFRAMVSGS